MIGIGSSNDAPLQQRGKVIAIEMDAAANADGLAKRRRPFVSLAMSKVSKVPRVRTLARNAFFPFEILGLTGVKENAIRSPRSFPRS